MKTTIKILLIILLSFSFSSCEEEMSCNDVVPNYNVSWVGISNENFAVTLNKELSGCFSDNDNKYENKVIVLGINEKFEDVKTTKDSSVPKNGVDGYLVLSTDYVNLLSDFFDGVSYKYNEHVLFIESMGRNTNKVKFIIKEITNTDPDNPEYQTLNEYQLDL